MLFRIEIEEGLYYVVQESDDICIAVYKTAKYAGRVMNFLNSGGAFCGDFPGFFTSNGVVQEKEDRNVVKQKP